MSFPRDITEEQIFSNKGLRPTANRILVLRAIRTHHHPVSLGCLEENLPTLDKASIFRALRDMAEADVLHTIDDGTGSLKYEECSSLSGCHPEENHIHFTCERCGETICLEDVSVPRVKLPEEYEVHHLTYLVKGICPKCR
ncbi:MAG: transcriptional repressor [Bacteroidales bacterium]|nr:transcriptional repressor [Bacteroidales bacterium]